jgi:hypothetical protein
MSRPCWTVASLARWTTDGDLAALIATAPPAEVQEQPVPAERTPVDEVFDPPANGIAFRIPIFVLEGWETADSGGEVRYIEPGALGRNALPRTIMAMTRNPDGGWGHDAAIVAGRIDTLERFDASAVINRDTGEPFGPGVWGWEATGYLTPHPDQPGSQATADYVRDKVLRGFSADMGEAEADYEVLEEDEDGWPEKVRIRITKASIGGGTITPFGAFPGAYIELVDEAPLTDEELPPVEARGITIVASAPVPQEPTGIAPVNPPAAWFQRVDQLHPTRHVYLARHPDGTPTGQTWGYIAQWGVPHSGFLDRPVYAPRLGPTGYATFLSQGSVYTAEGEELSCGLLTFGGGHLMDMSAGVQAALAHYDNAGTAYGKIVCGEDDFGVWYAGALSPMLTRAQIEEFASHPLSGDWRANPGDRNVRLCAALCVNTAGFNINPRAHIAASGARAIVAAGALPLARSAERAAAGGTDARAVEEAINRALRPVLASAARSSLLRLTRPRR